MSRFLSKIDIIDVCASAYIGVVSFCTLGGSIVSLSNTIKNTQQPHKNIYKMPYAVVTGAIGGCAFGILSPVILPVWGYHVIKTKK